MTQQKSAGGKLDERLSCLGAKAEKQTQLPERVTHLHLSQALRDLTGFYRLLLCAFKHATLSLIDSRSHRSAFNVHLRGPEELSVEVGHQRVWQRGVCANVCFRTAAVLTRSVRAQC